MSIPAPVPTGLFAKIDHWDLIIMFVLMAAIFTFEMMGVFNNRMITITAIIKDFVPMPLRWMIMSWLFWHFIGSDLWPNYIKTN